MPEVETTLQSKVIELASEALSDFCDNIGGMFGVDMSCEQVKVHDNGGPEIEKSFKKLAAVYSVKSTGALNGDFQILLDKAGLFTMAGVLVLLPESRILSNAKRGTLADTNEMSDAVGELGNLLIGSWDRTFKSSFEDSMHFVYTGTFIGDLCAEGNDVLDTARDDDAVLVSYKMCVGEYPAFQCGLYLPARLFDGSDSEPEPDGEDVPESEDVVPTDKDSEGEPAAEDEPEAQAEATVIVDVEEEASSEVEPELTSESQEENGSTEDAPRGEAVVTETLEPAVATVPSASTDLGASLLAKHLMQTQIHWATADDTVNQAQNKMQQIGVPYLLIGKDSKLEGIVTQSDLASAASVYLRPIFAKWRRPEDDATLQIRLKWIMSKQIYAVKPETPLSNIVHLICKYNLSYLPVVESQGQVLGVVATQDILKASVNKEYHATGVTVM